MVDVVVVGAGIIGLSVALNLQERGREVLVIDRALPGEATSSGNAGIIQADGVVPVAFTRVWSEFLSYARNRDNEAYYHWTAPLRFAPQFFAYWQNGTPEHIERTIRANFPLFKDAVSEHERLASAANMSSLLRRTGWMKVFRSEAAFLTSERQRARLIALGINSEILNKNEIWALEPGLSKIVCGGILFPDSPTLSDPLQLSRGYFELFKSRGGQFRQIPVTVPMRTAAGWNVAGSEARDVVLATGPWSGDLANRLGYRIPFFVKRGYHRHYASTGTKLTRPIYDAEGGYVIAPMDKGLRITTGVEFAPRDAKPTPVQLTRVEPWARELVALGQPIDNQSWLGSRPCLPDMIPVIGPATNHRGLWFCFGHGHHGLTLGPASGRLIAELITGTEPFIDPAPYRVDRSYY
ncbi:D-amino acid dehydrogenase [Gluconobacter frateurii M-2]|nr:D-amino acid dehydrogenase [Gluconobacter frateurii M-2]